MIHLKKIAHQRRLDVLEMVYQSKSGHIGGSMGCMDILVALYYHTMDIEKIRQQHPQRDRFILSKGHCAEALYAVLADQGFFPKAQLNTFSAFGTTLAEHPTPHIPGVEMATGALGHGLSVGVGMALGLSSAPHIPQVYVLMGDGELAEGSVWEAAMAASKYKLSNLVAIIDRNRLQISGSTEEVMPLDSLEPNAKANLEDKFSAFGWQVFTVDGHQPGALVDAFTSIKEQTEPGKPKAIIANTIKGYGASLMENKPQWHHQIPTLEEYAQIKAQFTQLLAKSTERGAD